MIKRTLGTTDMDISVIGLGVFAIGGWMWGPQDDADSLAAIRAAMTAANGGIPPERPEGRHRLWCAPGAGHGYLCEARADFNPGQAAIAWQALLDLFEQGVS